MDPVYCCSFNKNLKIRCYTCIGLLLNLGNMYTLCILNLYLNYILLFKENHDPSKAL